MWEGTGALFRINMRTVRAGDTEVKVQESSSMRNGNNAEITINGVVNGIVEVK